MQSYTALHYKQICPFLDNDSHYHRKENIDFQMDYGLGRIKITNTGILSSGIPINIQYEDNATFGFQQQNLMGIRLDYYLNEKLRSNYVHFCVFMRYINNTSIVIFTFHCS